MKKLTRILTFTLFACGSVWANTLTFDQAQQYYQTLSDQQVRQIAKQMFTQTCQQEYPNPGYKACSCMAELTIAEFRNNEIRDLVLPQSYWRYLTPSEVSRKIMKATQKAHQCAK